MKNIEEKQTWKYKTSVDDENSFLLINEIDIKNQIVHVSIFDLSAETGTFNIGHIPIDVLNLKSSLLSKIDVEEIDYSFYKDGYHEWKDAEGGVWKKSLKEIVLIIKKTIT